MERDHNNNHEQRAKGLNEWLKEYRVPSSFCKDIFFQSIFHLLYPDPVNALLLFEKTNIDEDAAGESLESEADNMEQKVR